MTFEVDLESTFSCLHPDDREGTFDKLLLTVSNKKAYDHEYRVVKPDGEVIHLWSSTRPTFNAEGEAVEVHGICQEITDRVQAEMALRESEDHYRHAVELNPQISFTAEPDGSIREVGPRWLSLTGMSREETLGQGWAGALHPDDLAGTAEKWSSCLLGGVPGDLEYRLRLRDGTYRWMRARAAPRFNAEGAIVRWYGAVEDIHGTGFSSLSYLRTFPFDKIKIDRSFVEDIGSAKQSEAIIRAVANLGRSLGMKTTAEGVETIEQLDWLKAEGCDDVQGYLFSKAVAADQVAHLLGGRKAGKAFAS